MTEITKTQKSATVTLHATDGSTMYIIAERKQDVARTYVITTDTAKKSSRGLTETHADFETAKAHLQTLAATAAPLGWKRKTAGRGFVAKPDAFATLPAAPGVAPAPTAVIKAAVAKVKK